MSGKTELSDLKSLIKSGNSIITIETHEEKRALILLADIAANLNVILKYLFP